MNERQLIACQNPCYTPDDLTNPIYEREMITGRLRLRSQLKVMGYLDNELWMATVFLEDAETGKNLRKNDLSLQEQKEINGFLESLLDHVGKEEITFVEIESDFEAVRFLSSQELKKLPMIDLDKICRAKERQSFALNNPCPSIDRMLIKSFTKIIDCGGFLFSTILTIRKSSNGFQWHSSSTVFDENQQPMPVFKTPLGAGKLSLEIASHLLKGVGTGKVFTYRMDDDTYVINMFRRLSVEEVRSISDSTAINSSENNRSLSLKRIYK